MARFWPEEPALWFAQREGWFNTYGITQDQERYDQVVKDIYINSKSTLKKIRDVVSSPPAEDKYETLKRTVIQRLSQEQQMLRQRLSQEQRTRQLLESLVIFATLIFALTGIIVGRPVFPYNPYVLPDPTLAVDSQETTQNYSSRYETPAEGRLLLEDNFDSFNELLWKREIKMPLDPDYEFCVYHNQNHEQLVQVRNGQLSIKPIILEDYYGENATAFGRLQLNGCTSTVDFECTRQALSYSILPPVISARFTTKERFSLRYGKIEIRAKFPQGDWLYPEMWLESRDSTYGANYASGRVLLGLTRGNENLVNATDVSKIFDARRLDFGVRVGASPNEIREILVTKVSEFGPRWTQDFHVYTTIWTSDGFIFLIDNEEVGRISPDEEGWLNGPHTDRKAAPFDQEFFLTLGVGVGGIRVFPDDTLSSGIRKPWRNVNVKAMLKFWNSRNEWLPSWRRNNGNNIAFVIDYVKVWAL